MIYSRNYESHLFCIVGEGCAPQKPRPARKCINLSASAILFLCCVRTIWPIQPGCANLSSHAPDPLSFVKTPRSRGTFRISNLPSRNIPVSPKWLEDVTMLRAGFPCGWSFGEGQVRYERYEQGPYLTTIQFTVAPLGVCGKADGLQTVKATRSFVTYAT